MSTTVKTINLSLPQKLLEQVDQQAKQQYQSRSEFVKEALRMVLQHQERLNILYSYGQQTAEQLGVKNEADVNQRIRDYRLGK